MGVTKRLLFSGQCGVGCFSWRGLFLFGWGWRVFCVLFFVCLRELSAGRWVV
jgi:hypothetical protein